MIAEMIGALLPTGLLAALYHWLFRRIHSRAPRTLVHVLSWLSCSALYMLGTGDGGSLWSLGRLGNGLALYALPQIVWLTGDAIRSRRIATARSSSGVGIQPRKAASWSRGPFQAWAGSLHGGQLVLALFVTIPVSLGSGLAALVLYGSASDARSDLRSGDYLDAPGIVDIGGATYLASPTIDSSLLDRIRRVVDSLRAEGTSAYDIEESLAEAKLPLERKYLQSTKAELEADASQMPLVVVLFGVAATLAAGAFVGLWAWFGARANRNEHPRTPVA